MENLVPIYRLRSGTLSYKDQVVIPFCFGLVFEEDGRYFFELFFDEELSLRKVYEDNETIFLNELFAIKGRTEDGYQILGTEIIYKSLPFSKSKGNFFCFGYVRIEKEPSDLLPKHYENGIKPTPDEQSLFYLKVEGLRMHFSEHTHVEQWRNGRKVNEYDMSGAWTHSSCTIHVNYESFETDWRLDEDGEVVIEFISESNSLRYLKFLEFKYEFISLLSFLNGAPVKVRAEYTGEYYTRPGIDSQIKYLYSIKKENNRAYNKFIPLNDAWFRGENIISRVFLFNFDKYIQVNKKLDLNNIIFYLNNAEQARSMKERVFIQTILLEMFSSTYADTLPQTSELLVDAEVFANIQIELRHILNKYKGRLGDSFAIMNGRIPHLNQAKRQQTEIKFRALVNAANIEITPEIEHILQVSRHNVIHRGDIGEDDMVYEVTDKLLRTIIINLIDYNGPTMDTEVGMPPSSIS